MPRERVDLTYDVIPVADRVTSYLCHLRLLASAPLTVAGPASAVVANVTITGTAGSNGTTTVTYRASATRAGTVRDIVVTP